MLAIAFLICIFPSASAFPHHEEFSKNFSSIILQSSNKIAQKDATCQPKMLEYLDALGKMEMWAIQMFDATSKLQSGITNGNLMDLGDFDVCLSVNHEGASGSIKGKHCLGYMSLIFSTKSNKWENLMANTRRIQNYPKSQSETAAAVLTSGWSMCIPDSCLAAEAAVYFNGFLQSLNLPLSIYATEDYCHSMETISQPLDASAIVATVFFSVILFLMVEQTLYDLYLHYKKSKPYHPSFIAFSVLTNGRKLFATGSNEGQLSCLDGIKAISMMWIVLGHRYTMISLGLANNSQEILKWLDTWPSMYIANATLAVDSFFLVGGLLVSYVFLKATNNSKKLFFNVPMFYLHRYLRLTPALGAMLLFQVGIFSYFGSGPLYPTINAMVVEPCKKWWWTTLLYVQNYVNTEEMCIGQTWYLNIDIQLFLLSPLVLIPLRRYTRAALSLAGLGIAFSMGWTLYIGRHYRVYAITTNLEVENTNYLLHYYNSTLTRATPWLLGLILGYFIHQIQKKQISFNPPKMLAYTLWPASLAIMLTCIFAGHDLREADSDPWANAFYLMLVRPVWSASLSWIILACLFGSGGFVNNFLSLPIFQVLSRLTYSVFLTHLLVMSLMVATARVNQHFSNYNMMYQFWGDYVFAHATGVLWCLAFESPVIVLEKLIFGRQKKKVEEVKMPEA